MTKINAKLVAITKPVIEEIPDQESLISYCARVSNPSNQQNYETSEKLLSYLIRNKHWSPLEMANAIVEVEAPRDITRQLLRHRSFSFQEFSQRYSDEIEFTEREFRRQDKKNRQNSIDNLEGWVKEYAEQLTVAVSQATSDAYFQLLKDNVAKECARVILPEGLTMSRLYVNGTLRSWLHYLDVRDDPGVTQWEHVLLAREIRKVLEPAFPSVFGALNEN